MAEVDTFQMPKNGSVVTVTVRAADPQPVPAKTWVAKLAGQGAAAWSRLTQIGSKRSWG